MLNTFIYAFILYKATFCPVCFLSCFALFIYLSIVCHFSDFTLNPLIVPVKVLKGHKVSNGLGVLDCEFHPKNPWIFSAGADCTVRLFH